MTLVTVNPATGETTSTTIAQTSPEEVSAIVTAARNAALAPVLRDRARRSALLRAIADAIDADRAELIALAASETGLSEARLDGEVARSSNQFRLFATAVDDGGYLEAAIDHAAGPGAPDLRRLLVPLGVVAVFGSSNFPFAFSVLGGDTASALAAGNAVVAKAHSSHPLTSQRSAEIVMRAIAEAGAPAGVFGIVYGQQAGRDLVAAAGVKAVGFTGSLGAAKALQEVIASRAEPIPFYGELSSLNPLIITRGAIDARGSTISEGLAASLTGSAGQLCTKPGVVFVPQGQDGFVSELARRLGATAAQPLLNRNIFDSLFRIQDEVIHAGAEAVRRIEPGGEGFGVHAGLWRVGIADLTEGALQEAFGPAAIVVEYDAIDDISAVLPLIQGSLTATVHAEEHELNDLGSLLSALGEMAGRLVFDGYPTGVRVSWAQHHGGPWPATNTLHTSVGVTAVRRFLRPLAYQDAPEAILPSELRDGYTGIPRRVDGALVVG